MSKLSPDGSDLVYSTYLGGSESEVIAAIAVDEQGDAYVTGETASDDFPTTPGVLQEDARPRHCVDTCTDAFVTKIAASGSALVYSTYLFGELDDAGSGIAVDGAGNAYVVGATVSSFFPTADAFQATNAGLADAFVVKLAPDGARLLRSSYLGGSKSGPSPQTGWDTGSSIAVDATGNAYVAGYTQSFDFPTTANAFQAELAATTCDFLGSPCGDIFVAKIAAEGPGVLPPIWLMVTPEEVVAGGTVSVEWAGLPALPVLCDRRERQRHRRGDCVVARSRHGGRNAIAPASGRRRGGLVRGATVEPRPRFLEPAGGDGTKRCDSRDANADDHDHYDHDAEQHDDDDPPGITTLPAVTTTVPVACAACKVSEAEGLMLGVYDIPVARER